MWCRARSNRTIPCEGEFVESEGLCFRHACLFDVWIANGGWRVYAFNPDGLDTPRIGGTNPRQLRRWKRAQFHGWLNTLTIGQVETILNEGA